jgi:hypothetical protein
MHRCDLAVAVRLVVEEPVPPVIAGTLDGQTRERPTEYVIGLIKAEGIEVDESWSIEEDEGAGR